MESRIDSFRVADLVALAAAHRCGSVSGAARQLKVTPSQVSKAIARLESLLNRDLISRSSRGVQLTDAGLQILPRIQRVVDELNQMRLPIADQRTLSLAAPSYLNAMLLPLIAALDDSIRFRALDLAPSLIRTAAGETVFDICLLVGETTLPDAWSISEVGQLRKGLFASPELAARLGTKVDADELREVPFVTPVAGKDGRYVPMSDDCPLGSKRRKGHEAFTIVLALEIAASSDNLVFGPLIAARQQLRQGKLVEIEVRGWDERETIFVACHGDRVRASEERRIVALVQEGLVAAGST